MTAPRHCLGWCRIAPVAAAAALLAAMGLSAGGDSPAPQTTPAAADPTIERQREICFPDGTGVKTFTAEGVVVWTDAPLDGKGVLADLTAAVGMLEEMLPAPTSGPATRCADRPVALAVYARRADYLALWPRVGNHYEGRFAAIATEGYSFRVFCATSCDSAEAFAARRGVLCHEMAHVWLYQRQGLPNDSHWLTEGIANALQLRIDPAAGDRREFLRYLEEGRMLPLKRLMDQKRITSRDYWQAATLTEVLIERYGGRLPRVVEAVKRGDSAYRIVTGVLETDFYTLGRQWAEHVRAGATTTRPAAAPRP